MAQINLRPLFPHNSNPLFQRSFWFCLHDTAFIHSILHQHQHHELLSRAK
jgi:hypothetical protein